MLSILIIDQNPLVCFGIQALLNHVIKTPFQSRLASSKKELDGLNTNFKIDLLILGLYENPEIDTLYLEKKIFETHPDTRLIAFYETFSLESMIYFSHKRGLGFISKPRVKDELGSCLVSVLKGEMYTCEDTSQNIIKAWTEKRTMPTRK